MIQPCLAAHTAHRDVVADGMDKTTVQHLQASCGQCRWSGADGIGGTQGDLTGGTHPAGSVADSLQR